MAAGEQATARLSNFGRRWWLWASCSRVSRGCSAGAVRVLRCGAVYAERGSLRVNRDASGRDDAMRARLGLCGSQLRPSFSKRTGPPPPVLQPRTLAQPYTATLCLFPYTACSWQLPARPLLFPGPCAVVQLCVLTPSSTSAPNYRDITLHAIKSTPGMAHSLHTALQPHLVSASLHHLSKLAVIAQQCHSLTKTVMMIQPYKAAQGYLAIHSVHQTPEP
ncbi:hypothetical protein JI435_400810 [Parastagonospora nodorum SN15]|uniref:Uncharacterized protein n=1 Tax=Phaeosphaeria nodorum (strain SN15 / ATCC MYA-4574 / FGSC 10173) TaxID=321614 RepID=A0A7U2EQ70_PHANO|nr:hypothetical protein HBH46_008450 [Parastagonospora nodorum]KAH5774357.1 hypothetical protein HBI17_003230 [Parastagonospora nodorum]KAH6232792.1 hypothetical protein HBI43_023490 [Parastagonospora nodorum]KAH6275390.1 hypothetical protein HBI42_006410 [Parastagonospora nodorum]QRC90970.1 hypothetical protein JI435_400810 [Parastagonospora nodorum SN15]